jgi:prophage maintenance system killer protein
LDITGVEMVDGIVMGGDRLQKILHPEKKDNNADHYDISGKYTLKISTEHPYNLALFENDNLWK